MPPFDPSVSVRLGPSNDLAIRVDSHEVSIPLTEAGLKTLHTLLVHRQTAAAQAARPTIGQPASPISYVVTQWAKQHTQRAARPKTEAQRVAELLKDVKIEF